MQLPHDLVGCQSGGRERNAQPSGVSHKADPLKRVSPGERGTPSECGGQGSHGASSYVTLRGRRSRVA